MKETMIKICGLRREADVLAVNGLRPQFAGFVLVPASRRYVVPEQARRLRERLDPGIRAVGVFADEEPAAVAALLNSGAIDLAQLHGHEDAGYLARLRAETDKPLIQAFRIRCREDAERAEASAADWILLDAGAGDGKTFDWSLAGGVRRPYFLAGGLEPGNVRAALEALRPFGVDVSSGVETDGKKDIGKMRAFVQAVRAAGNPAGEGEGR